MIADRHVVAVIGTLCSASAVEASPLLSRAGLVMISPTNTSPALTSDLAGSASAHYHPGYFRTASNDLYQGQAVARFAYRHLGLRRMVSIEDGDSYTRPASPPRLAKRSALLAARSRSPAVARRATPT